jgi:membrane associated rhomboid family serine protease
MHLNAWIIRKRHSLGFHYSNEPHKRRLEKSLLWVGAGAGTACLIAIIVRCGGILGLLDQNPSADIYALQPRCLAGLVGIIHAPWLHHDIDHLMGNCRIFVLFGMLAGGIIGWRWMLGSFAFLWLSTGAIEWICGVNMASIEQPTKSYGFSAVAFGIAALALGTAIRRVSAERELSRWYVPCVLALLGGAFSFIIGPEMAVNVSYYRPFEYLKYQNDVDHAINWTAHLTGFLLGMILVVLWKPKPETLELDLPCPEPSTPRLHGN